MYFKLIKFSLRILVAVGLFYYLVYFDRIDFNKLQLFFQHPYFFLIYFFILGFNNILLNSWRLHVLLGAANTTILKLIPLTMLGNMFNSLLPGALSGDVIKGVILLKKKLFDKQTAIIWLLLSDRISGLNAQIVLAASAYILGGFLFYPAPKFVSIMIFSLVIFMLAYYIGLILLARDGFKLSELKILSTPTKIEQELKLSRHIQALAISIVIFISTILLIALSADYVISEIKTNLAVHFMLVPLGFLLVTIPITPAGIGYGHVVFDVLYGLFGISGGADIFNIYVALQVLGSLLGVIPLIVWRGNISA